MGVLRPGTVAPQAASPEERRRLKSGVWSREYNFETSVESWTLDKKKLNQLLAEALYDPDVAALFHRSKRIFVDRMFGDGTFAAYTTNKRPEFTDEEREMATYWIGNDTATTASTSGTIITSTGTHTGAGFGIDRPRQALGSVQERPHQKRGQLVTKVPFKIETGGFLLSSLQREFDRWAKPQMALIHG